MTKVDWLQRISAALIACTAGLVGAPLGRANAQSFPSTPGQLGVDAEGRLTTADRALVESRGKLLIEAINAGSADERQKLIREDWIISSHSLRKARSGRASPGSRRSHPATI